MPELYLADALGAVGKPMFRVHTAGSVGGSTAHRRRQPRRRPASTSGCSPSPSRSSPSPTRCGRCRCPIPFQPPLHRRRRRLLRPAHPQLHPPRRGARPHRHPRRAQGPPERAEEPVRPPARARHHVRVGQGVAHAVGPDPLLRDLPVLRRRLRDGAGSERWPTPPRPTAARRPGSTARRCAASRRCRAEPRHGAARGRQGLRRRRLRAGRHHRPAPARSTASRCTCRSRWYEPMWLENLGFAEPGEGWKLTEDGRHRARRRPAGQHVGRRAVVQPDRRVGHDPLRRGGAAGARPGRRPPGRRRPHGPSATPTAAARSSSPCGWSAPTSRDGAQ